MDELNMFVRQGWQCPVCKRIYSPDTFMCYYCNNGINTNTIATTNTDEIKFPESRYAWEVYAK